MSGDDRLCANCLCSNPKLQCGHCLVAAYCSAACRAQDVHHESICALFTGDPARVSRWRERNANIELTNADRIRLRDGVRNLSVTMMKITQNVKPDNVLTLGKGEGGTAYRYVFSEPHDASDPHLSSVVIKRSIFDGNDSDPYGPYNGGTCEITMVKLLSETLVESGICPHFPLYFGHAVNTRTKSITVATDFAHFGTFGNYISNLDEEEVETQVERLTFHILFALYAAQRAYPGFRHNDLHSENVFVRGASIAGHNMYTLHDGTRFDVPNKGSEAIVSDFDWSTIPGYVDNVREATGDIAKENGMGQADPPALDCFRVLNSMYASLKLENIQIPFTERIRELYAQVGAPLAKKLPFLAPDVSVWNQLPTAYQLLTQHNLFKKYKQLKRALPVETFRVPLEIAKIEPTYIYEPARYKRYIRGSVQKKNLEKLAPAERIYWNAPVRVFEESMEYNTISSFTQRGDLGKILTSWLKQDEFYFDQDEWKSLFNEISRTIAYNLFPNRPILSLTAVYIYRYRPRIILRKWIPRVFDKYLNEEEEDDDIDYLHFFTELYYRYQMFKRRRRQ